MALVVEDGSAKVDAESYASVAAADAYCSARAVAGWASRTTTDKEVALRNATDFMVQSYRTRWKGSRYTVAQALDWPRVDVPRPDGLSGYRASPNYYLPTDMPVEVVRACIELAIRAAAGPLIKDLGREVQSVRVDVVTVSYTQGSREQARFEAVERLLDPLLHSGSGRMAVSRG